MSQISIKLNTNYLKPFLSEHETQYLQADLRRAHEAIQTGTGAGSAFLGWKDPSKLADANLISEIEQSASRLRESSDALVVIGIGGSYLGARAVVEALATADSKPVYFAGNNISADYHKRLLDSLKGKRVAVNVISKSGTTTEPAIAFRIFKEWLETSVGKDEASKLIVATTDANKGALLDVAVKEGYQRFVVPDDVGGRFSVLSPVGLLPIAYAGIDISSLVDGAMQCQKRCFETPTTENPVFYYAAARNALYAKGYAVEMFSHFEPRLHYVAEWWKQLYGESEGKDGKSLFPASLDLTADLHSMGQYAQQGKRFLIETFVAVEDGEAELKIPDTGGDADGLGYLAGRTLAEVNKGAFQATALAHWEGGVPVMSIHLGKLDEAHLGGLLFFYEYACALSGYLLRVNPFDQPGVEAYKKHMFALLGKPGYEEKTKELTEKVTSAARSSALSL